MMNFLLKLLECTKCLTHYPHDEQKLKWIFGHKILIGAQNINILGYRLTLLRQRGQVDKRYAQIISSAFPYPIKFHGWRVGCHRKGAGGSQVWISKPYTDFITHAYKVPGIFCSVQPFLTLLKRLGPRQLLKFFKIVKSLLPALLGLVVAQ